ncbi:heavy metal translocating P-type ATPase [Dolosicoccus paucivorans]|uniref:P-type Cu(+) transporter n=2 Tax=Dolosicoccus paucivorans TaxID=84521 RepID=A0A2N6SL65_9LACT|nr:heavy metal translocating P-type ATPase [Dolosicoccus paucivorans]PMC57824.1 heavy metal translocating P-type ATPase [Dolosicoccus paucivorans]
MQHHAHHDHENHIHDQHDHHGGHHHGNFKEILIKSLPLAIPIMILSPMMGIQFPFQFTFKYSDIIVAILATILLIYGGKPFYTGALDEFKQKSPGMMALVTMGIGVSYLYSIYAVAARYTTGTHVMDFFFEFASLILIMLLGHWIEMKAIGEAGDARESLAALIPKEADVEQDDGSFTKKPVADLEIGDIVRVQGGENIPADGEILRGSSQVNEALLTGESKPVAKEEKDTVISGSTNGDGTLYIKVTQTGDQSFIAQVQDLVSSAQNQPSHAENLAHKVSGWLFYIAVSAAVIAFILWWIVADLSTAVTYAITTLVIACPHALGLAIPLVIARSTSLGANHGLLVKDREALELAAKADTIILDKTGTLTTGNFKVLQIDGFSTHSEEDILRLLAGLESGSSHPIAQSIVNYSQDQKVTPADFEDIEIIKGSGLTGKHNGHFYQLISQKSYGKELNFAPPTGATVSILLEDDQAIGAVSLGDSLKETSKHLIQSLKDRGIQPIMATGDNEEAAKSVAEELDIEYYANQSPEDKYRLVEQLKKQGQEVIMVGDGVNDAPSLALADVGIAIGAGTQVAIDSADVILTQSEPGDIEAFIELAQKTTRKMKENLLWGAGYNFIAIPLAAGLLAPIGFSLSPAVGAILMSLSTVIVAINAMALKLNKE